MKNFFVLLFVLTNSFLLLTANAVQAQKASLVKQGQWGSQSYNQVISLNGYFYASTSVGQIDVIDQSKSGIESFVGQIDLNEYVIALQVHNNRLVVVTKDKLSIFDVSNVKELTRKYSIVINTHNKADALIVSKNIYLSNDNKIYIIQENDNDYTIKQIINTTITGSTTANKMLLTDKYFYNVSQKDNEDYTKKITTIEKYNITDNSLVESVRSDSIDSFQDVLPLGIDQFIIATKGDISILAIDNNNLNVATTFSSGSSYYISTLALKNNTLHALSSSRQLYTYSITDDNQLVLLSQNSLSNFLTINNVFSQLKWSNDRLIALSSNEGVFEITFDNQTFNDIKYFYNQSGHLDKGTFAGSYYLLPRSSRVDVLNITDIENIKLHKQFEVDAERITSHQGSYILNGTYTIGLYNFSDEQELTQQSSANFINHTSIIDSVQSAKFIYSLAYLNGDLYLFRYGISTPYSLFETPMQVPISRACCGFATTMIVKDGKIMIHDSSLNGIHIFSDIENSNFSYEQFVDYPEEYDSATYSSDITYIATEDKLTSYSVSNTNEFVVLNHVDVPWGTSPIELKVIGSYLMANTPNEIFLFELEDITNPKYISSLLIDNYELWRADFQFINNTLIATTWKNVQFYKINKAPTSEVVKLILDEDSSIEPLIIFTDPESDIMTFTISQESTNGETTIDELGLVYTPSNNFNGEDSIIIKAQDIHGNFIEHKVSITVEPVNDAPTVSTSSLTTNENTNLVVQIEVEDIEGDEISFILDTEPLHGSASLSTTGELSFQPDDHYSGTDSISITITDTNDASYSAEIPITITPVNNAPTTNSLNFTVLEDNILEGTIETSDIENHVVTIEVLDKTSIKGDLTVSNEGAIYYSPTENYNGEVSFQIRLTDVEEAISDYDITLTVTPVDDIPLAPDMTFTVQQGALHSDKLPEKDVDEETLAYTIAANVNHGILTLSTSGQYNYTPDITFSGSDSFTYNVADETNTAQGTITFTVQAKPAEIEAESSGGGSINVALIVLLLLNITYRYKNKTIFK